MEQFLKQFLRASPDLFKVHKLYDESCVALDEFLSPQQSSSSSSIVSAAGQSRGRGDREGEQVVETTGKQRIVFPNPDADTDEEGGEGEGEDDSEQDFDGDGEGGTRQRGRRKRPRRGSNTLIEFGRGTGSSHSIMMVPSQVKWCRTTLKRWADAIGLDFEFCRIVAPPPS